MEEATYYQKIVKAHESFRAILECLLTCEKKITLILAEDLAKGGKLEEALKQILWLRVALIQSLLRIEAAYQVYQTDYLDEKVSQPE